MKQTAVRLSAGVFGAAAVIALVTLVSRVVGFLRTVVLGQTLGADCLGAAYTTANAVPNVVFEVVAGGALVGAVVPLLAGSVARGNPEHVAATVRALTGWVLLLLVPAAAVVALLAGPIVNGLTGSTSGCDGSLLHQTATSMLVIFAVQIPIYGLTVVSQGTLQAHHRFIAPALAPLISSLVVVSAYGLYWGMAGEERGSLAGLTTAQLAVLAWGTTLGVVALWVTQWPGMSSTGLLLLRPRLRFPPGVAARARQLAAAGAVTVAAQWVAFAVALRLANDRGVAGTALVYTLAWTVFLLPWAILALPVATSAFPRFSAFADVRDGRGFEDLASTTVRAVVVAGGLGAAGVVAVARPVADLMLMGAPGRDQTAALADALVAFAPGVLGFAVAGHISRMLYARHKGRAAAILVAGGWLLGIVVGWLATSSVSDVSVAAALGLGSSVGMLVAGALSIVVMARVVGRRSLHGLARTSLGTALGGVVSLVVGLGLAAVLPESSTFLAAIATVVVSVVVVAAFAACLAVVDREALTALTSRVRAGRAGQTP